MQATSITSLLTSVSGYSFSNTRIPKACALITTACISNKRSVAIPLTHRQSSWMVLGLEHRESNSAHESQTANGWNQAGGRKSLGCSPEDTVMPCCQAAWRRGKPFRARLHSSSCVVMPVSASAMSFSDKLELSWPSFTPVAQRIESFEHGPSMGERLL